MVVYYGQDKPDVQKENRKSQCVKTKQFVFNTGMQQTQENLLYTDL